MNDQISCSGKITNILFWFLSAFWTHCTCTKGQEEAVISIAAVVVAASAILPDKSGQQNNK